MASPSKTNSRINLSGSDWQLKDYVGEDWLWRNAHKPGPRDARGWRPATVPGSVHHDLWQNGEISNPYYERNSLLIEWIPQRTWLYKRSFRVDEALRGRRLRLCFEGIDYSARIYLNGELLGQHSGMFVPASFEVGERVLYGEDNWLAVVLDPAPVEQPQVGYTSQVRTLKTRMNYWWDFCPRVVHLGLWDDVYLEASGPVRVEDVFVRPQLKDSLERADVRIEATVECQAAVEAQVTTMVHFEGQAVASHSERRALPGGPSSHSVTLAVVNPRLWWPNGHGEQPLYTATVEVSTLEPEAAESHGRQVRFGIRRLAWAPNTAASPTARPYTVVVNGKPIYIKGWNWVPMDALYGVERPAKLRRLLRLAQRAHANLLRVWGGGLIEREAFYETCDELGLLVWQEFPQSSSGIDNCPPETEAYVGLLTEQARSIIPRRRNHPSLAIWCGGNELQSGHERPLDESHAALAALHAAVRELDPDRLWLPTSSSGPVFSNNLENIERDPLSLHDVHGPWEHQGLVKHFTLYNAGTALLHSEFGVEGLTNRRALDAVLAPEHQWPVTLDNPYWQHLGAWWVKAPRWREMLGEVGDVESLRRATQFLQASGLGYAVEANRRRKFQNSGSLPWQFNEPYPMAACTSAVDYFAQPKPVYYAVLRAYMPVHVTAKFAQQAWAGESNFTAEVWANNSLGQAIEGARLSAGLVGLSGREYARLDSDANVSANAASLLAVVRWPLDQVEDEIFFLDLRLARADGQPVSFNRYTFSRTADLSPLLTAPATTLTAELERQADNAVVAVTNTGASTALFVWLEDTRGLTAPGYVYCGDNDFCLLPGERRLIAVDWDGVPGTEQRLMISGWNTNTVNLE